MTTRPRLSATAWCSVASSSPSTVRSLEKVGFTIELYPVHPRGRKDPKDTKDSKDRRRSGEPFCPCCPWYPCCPFATRSAAPEEAPADWPPPAAPARGA